VAPENLNLAKEKDKTAKKATGESSKQGKTAGNQGKEKKKGENAGEGFKRNPSEQIPTKSKKNKPEESKGAASAPGDASVKESPMKKQKKQKLNLALVHTLPKNIEEAKIQFFESNCTINPIFEYENYAATQKFLAQFKEPSDQYLDLSKRILDSFIEIYGSETAYLETEGEVVSKEETLQVFTDYLDALGFSELLTIQFKGNQVAPTSVTHDPKTGKSRVNIRDPPEYRRGRLFGVIDHEIGTHYIRKYNERFQTWHKKRDKFELKNCIQTEEGFACVNQLVRTVSSFAFRRGVGAQEASDIKKQARAYVYNKIFVEAGGLFSHS